MKRTFAAILFLTAARCALAVDVPPANPEYRAQITKEYMGLCVKGIEDLPDLRAMYSRKTIETYCTCRQRFRADVLAQAIKNDERGKAVSDRASDYSQEKCAHILLKNLEKE